MNRHPSALNGVPVNSPSPAASDADSVNALVSVGAVVRPIFFSFGWLRVLDRSCPNVDQSPPACFAGAQ
jgi:hypothetical protein